MNILLLLFIFFPTVLVTSKAFDSNEGGLSIPKNAVGRPPLPLRESYSENNIFENSINRNLCYCTYEDGICDSNKTCIKHPLAACFHAIEEVFNREERRMETWHKYGCAPLEKGSDASHLICNSWRSAHFHPKSIACCYEGNYCNRNITPPPYVNAGNEDWIYDEQPLELYSKHGILLIFLIVFILGSVINVLYFWTQKKRKEQLQKKALADEDLEKEILIDDSGSGSGSGQTTLNQRTVAQDLEIIKIIGRGRYGEVRKALYRGSYVAVKTFSTTDEESWKNERDVYQTHMLNHENILQYVAADISSEDSITKMLLITDFHEHGSLCDYLQREESLTIEEALQLAYSTICGIDHLHNSVHGTGSRKKPEIAHRDIKSKNIIVKRKGVCCVADFGLAVRFEGKLIPEKVNVQVGTKRYMAPEVLNRTLMPSSFSQFKMADMYAYALVMWEIARRTELPPEENSESATSNSSSSDSGLGESEEGSGPMSRRLTQKSSLDLTTRAMPYVPPFKEMVESDPSFDEMRRIVCEEKRRPPLEESWTNGSNLAMFRLACLMRDCWHPSPNCRHTALKVKMELLKAIEDLQDRSIKSQKKSTSSMSGSIPKRDTVDSGFRENVS